jgi:hypothetical protein
MAFITCIMFGRTLPSSFAKILAAELEFDNPELSEWAVRSYRGMRHGRGALAPHYVRREFEDYFK